MTQNNKQDRTFNFTQNRIKDLPPAPLTKRIEYFDTDCKKLICRVSDKGTKTFAVLKRVGNTSKRITLGQYPDLSVNDARVKAQKILVDLSNGINPTEEKRKAKLKGMTLGELFERYLADKNDLREATIKDYRKNIKAFTAWLEKPNWCVGWLDSAYYKPV